MIAVGELSGPLVTGWVLPYIGVREWCGLLVAVGLAVLAFYTCTLLCCKGKTRDVLIPSYSNT